MLGVIEFYKKREVLTKGFYENEKYLELIKEVLEKKLDIDSYSDEWTEEIDIFFEFLYSTAKKMFIFEEEVIVKYENEFISLFEIHGQGCFRRIKSKVREPKKYIEFNDIVKRHKMSGKSFRNHVLKAIHKAFNELEMTLDSEYLTIEDTEISICDIKSYIKENLK